MTLTKILIVLTLVLNGESVFAQEFLTEQEARQLIEETLNSDWLLQQDDSSFVGSLCLPEEQMGEVMPQGDSRSAHQVKVDRWEELLKIPADLLALNATLRKILQLSSEQEKDQEFEASFHQVEYLSQVCMVIPSIYSNFLSFTLGGRQCVGVEGQKLSRDFFESIKTQCIEMQLVLFSLNVDAIENLPDYTPSSSVEL